MSKRLDFNTLKSDYDTIIFDMDGVMTSEQTYWDCAALTAYEYINSELYFGSKVLNPSDLVDNLSAIRKSILCDDRVISLCKNIGVNSNWDLAYVVIALRLEFGNDNECVRYLENCRDVSELYENSALLIASNTDRALDECKRNKRLWNEIVSCFQEWYLGQDEFERIYKRKSIMAGKPFLCKKESPLLNLEQLSGFLKKLRQSGMKIGIATGRNAYEISVPLKNWGIYGIFDENKIVTYDDVQNAEALMLRNGTEITLAKPSPYCFLKSALGRDYDDEKIISGNYKISDRVIVVGDAGADIFAAQKAGFDFLAVLTGINGEKTRGFFEENGATYVNSSLLDVL